LAIYTKGLKRGSSKDFILNQEAKAPKKSLTIFLQKDVRIIVFLSPKQLV